MTVFLRLGWGKRISQKVVEEIAKFCFSMYEKENHKIKRQHQCIVFLCV